MTFSSSWDNMRHAHNSLYMVILTYKPDITGYVTKRNEKKKRNGKNTTEPSNGSRFKFWPEFWQIYNLAMERAFKKFIAPEQINMSFTFAYIKCQAKQCSTHWNLLLFFSLCCHFQYFTHGWILLIGFHDCRHYLYWKGVPLIKNCLLYISEI